MRLLVVVALGLLLLVTPVWRQSAESPAAPKGMLTPPPGTWVQQPNTRVLDALERSLYSQLTPGGRFNAHSFYAYSGGDLAQINGVWGLLLFGGGHAATPDNSLIFVPLDGSGPRRLMGPYLAPDGEYKYDVPLETYKPAGIYTAALKSRHTYSGIVVGEKNGKPHLFMNGGSLYTGGGGGSGVMRTFDLTQSFSQAMSRPDMGWTVAGSPAGNVTAAAGWDPKRKQVLVRGVRGWAAYFPDGDRWDNLTARLGTGGSFGSDVHASVAVDVDGRRMYVIGDGLAESINLDTYEWRDVGKLAWARAGGGGGLGFTHRQNSVWGDTTGFLGGPGIGWHGRTRQIVAYVGDSRLLVFDPTKDVPARVVTMSGAPVVGREDMIFGRFRVIPGTDQVALAMWVDHNVYIGTVPFD